MRTLLSHGVAAGITGRDRVGYTPLHLACFCGHAKAVRLLLANPSPNPSPNPNSNSNLSPTPTPNQVRLLLERNANMLATDSDGATPLHLAASRGHAEAVRSLLQAFEPQP